MKNEAKAWTSNLGTLYSPSKLQQILCENQSGFSAVQASPDFSKPSVSVLISQSISAEAEKRTKDCAKPSADWLRANLHLSNAEIAALYGCGVRQVETILYGAGLKRSAAQRLAIAKKQNSGTNNPMWNGGIAKNHYHWKKLQRQRYPERVNARQAVHRAVKSGKLTPLPCQFPGCVEQKAFAHHHDYSKPLDVVWLCRPHHLAADRVRRHAA